MKWANTRCSWQSVNGRARFGLTADDGGWWGTVALGLRYCDDRSTGPFVRSGDPMFGSEIGETRDKAIMKLSW